MKEEEGFSIKISGWLIIQRAASYFRIIWSHKFTQVYPDGLEDLKSIAVKLNEIIIDCRSLKLMQTISLPTAHPT
jgi:hypothetical protein